MLSPPKSRDPESVDDITVSCEESQTRVTAMVEKKLGAVQNP